MTTDVPSGVTQQGMLKALATQAWLACPCAYEHQTSDTFVCEVAALFHIIALLPVLRFLPLVQISTPWAESGGL